MDNGQIKTSLIAYAIFGLVLTVGALIMAPTEKIKGAKKSSTGTEDYGGAIKNLEMYAIMFMIIGGTGILATGAVDASYIYKYFTKNANGADIQAATY